MAWKGKSGLTVEMLFSAGKHQGRKKQSRVLILLFMVLQTGDARFAIAAVK